MSMLLIPLAFAAPDDASLWEARLHAWYLDHFAPTARLSRSGAGPQEVYRYQGTTRWGPDTAVYPQTCASYLSGLGFDSTENGCEVAEVARARTALGPSWASVPSGFDSWSVNASFRRNPGATSLPPHLSVAVTRLAPGIDPRRMFDAGIAQGCGVVKSSFAFLWSDDTLIRLDSPCSEHTNFARWTRMVADALPAWTGQPTSDPFVYGECGTVAVRWTTRGALDARQ